MSRRQNCQAHVAFSWPNLVFRVTSCSAAILLQDTWYFLRQHLSYFFLPLLLNSLFAFQVTIHCPLFIFMDVQTCLFLFTRCLNSTALSRCLNFSTCTILCGCVSRGTQINGLRNWAKQARVWEASSYTFKRLSPIFIGHLVAQPYFPPYVLYYLQTLIPNEPLIINFFLKKI